MLESKMQHQSGSCAPSSVCMILLQPLEHLWFASKICPEWGNGHFQTGIMAQVVDLYLAVSSQRSYRCAQTCFMEFCQRLNIPPLPAAKQLMLLFVAELSQRLWHSSVWSYLSAVRHLHISKVVGDPLKGLLRLELVLKSLQKFNPNIKKTGLPITPFTMRIVKGVLEKDPLSYENILLWAMCFLGFFAFYVIWGNYSIPGSVWPKLALDPTRPGSQQSLAFHDLESAPARKEFWTLTGPSPSLSLTLNPIQMAHLIELLAVPVKRTT